ncbi:hypothetical protein P3X46_020806 [Hevea brasiliensis]|uniref:DUF4005 domain-containing protein n=1 Tax=Hevea brasiliensis TaxID=3981 RepID=A0ABQ9LDL4_HEVBR|nr:protein IQ-DOMAIN 32 [Hevea brasiliensis]KAJ9166001.1 hypothetical protein P3X46_020806 [Hevea brasiliensis]
MGRSTSCFKIITCGGGSADKDDLQAPENKNSTEGCGWSFRKRSVRHRVLSNTIITEASYSANKESTESASLNFQSPDTSTVPDKISVIQCTDEKPHLSTFADSKVSETFVVAMDESEVDAQLEESVVIVIQAAVRGCLAQRELIKLKNLVKLQAVVRGHLVRRHAVGTLRCIQAIVKMQALVRTRCARLMQEGSYTEEKIDGKHEKAILKTSGKGNSITKPDIAYTSIEKLLSNRFARQLMESTPKTRPIHIKCDSSKPNSAWNWLERWMSVSSTEPTPKPELTTEQQLEIEKSGDVVTEVEAAVPSEGFCESKDSKSNIQETILPSETEDNLVTYDADDFKFQEHHLTSSLVGDNSEQPQPKNISASDAKEPSIDTNSLPNQTMESDVNCQMEISCKAEIEGEQTDQPKRSMKRYASEQPETEGKKFVFGSRKVSKPAFIAAQSKFEEPSSTANSNRSLSSSYQDGGVESNMDTISCGTDTVMRTKALNMVENSVPNNSRAQYGGSECGTELSVTSTLDSPDVFEVGAAECDHEAKSTEKENPKSTEDVVVEVKNASTDLVSNLSDRIMIQPEQLDSVIGEAADSIVATDSRHIEMKPERSASDVQRELDSEAGGPTYRSSPEASPRSHIAVPESQGTPSSQVSSKDKRNKADKSASNQKRKSISESKQSPTNPNHDSGARSSVEQMPKDQRNGKRRNSFGSARPDPTDQEPRDDGSSSSSSLPHFMQATESARAKIQANNSPRSSPDVQDRDYIKKRHSLPGANGRQGSPRIQRSMSQAQPGAKGNGSHVIHEKKWQR